MKVAYLFPGQGAQTVGMGKGFYDTVAASRRWFELGNSTLGYDLTALCFDGPAERLNRTDVSQPALLIASMASYVAFQQSYPRLDQEEVVGFAGLSLGEFTALAAADAFAPRDALRVVQVRGEAMQACCDAAPSGMAAVLGLDRPSVEEACLQARDAGTVVVANLNMPGQIVISGAQAALEMASRICKERGARRVIPLTVAGAYHSPLMKPAQEKLQAALAQTTIRAPRSPVVTNVRSSFLSNPNDIRNALADQLVSPVRWEDSMRALLQAGVQRFYEFGPGRVLTGILKKTAPECPVISIETPADLEALCRSA
jgi:[acyl-carrier-protein] S-malonyltransferase